MKILGMMLVKDEADILEEFLSEASKWADHIFVIDNGSEDGSWEIIQSMKSDKIVPWKQDFSPYRRTMRAEIFQEFRNLAEDGDWWFFADVDEFYVENPREFLVKVPEKYQVVFKKSIDYFLTKEDIEEYMFTGDFKKDKEYIRYINPACWTETRFFRYYKKMKWNVTQEKPKFKGLLFPEPIIVKHYQHRSPMQMQHRLDIRNRIPKDQTGRPFRHVKEKHWTEMLKSRKDLLFDEGYEQYKKLPLKREIREPVYQKLYKQFLFYFFYNNRGKMKHE